MSGQGRVSATAIEPFDPALGSPFGAGPILSGFAVILTFSLGLGGWSMTVPIEGAVVAPGLISVDSSVRTIQHLEGGIVEQILVREGDKVDAGQILIHLEDTLPASALNEVRAQYFEARATEARLIAERGGAQVIDFPAELRDQADQQAAQEAMSSQQAIFETRRTLLRNQRDILERTLDGLASQIDGLQGQIQASEDQATTVRDELDTANRLFEQGLTDRPRVLDLQRTAAALEGSTSQLRAEIGVAQQKVQETRLQISELETSRANEIEEQIREARSQAYEMSQKIDAAQDVMSRTEIRSPIAGAVVGLSVHTVGGVIAPGETLMEIVPLGDKLVVQAMIDPLDIDQVKTGLPAIVWLSALNRRTQSAIEAKVSNVSADRITDPHTGIAYYSARVELDPDAVGKSSVPLQPGMSAEVMIDTGARTTWEYLSAPIAKFLSRALRED